MKIAIISDLHREFWELYIPHYNCDVVVFAGDISSPIKQTMPFLVNYSKKFKGNVIAVLGNHDFYGSNYEDALKYAKDEASKVSNLFLLENDCCIIKDIKFIGCTLWTDFSLEYSEKHNLSYLDKIQIAQNGVADFARIKTGANNKNFTGYKAIELFKNSCGYINNELQKKSKYKNIIVTHFSPDIECNSPKNINSLLLPYFVANTKSITDNSNIAAWIYGHTHYSNKFNKFNINFIGNHMGYPLETSDTGGEIEFYFNS